MLLKNKGFKEGRVTKVGLYAIDKSTPLESNKSQSLLFLVRSPVAVWEPDRTAMNRAPASDARSRILS